MPDKCIHLRAAVIATDAQICGADGTELRGSVRWCTSCGAILALADGMHNRWLQPGSSEIATALESLYARQAQAAATRKGVARG